MPGMAHPKNSMNRTKPGKEWFCNQLTISGRRRHYLKLSVPLLRVIVNEYPVWRQVPVCDVIAYSADQDLDTTDREPVLVATWLGCREDGAAAHRHPHGVPRVTHHLEVRSPSQLRTRRPS
jgi:hypothetical protein